MLNFNALAADTCSRIAIVNYQEILVDPSTNAKGEGLRYYLEKDHSALEHLNKYQKNNAPKWQTATLSTAGSALLLSGVLRSNSDSSDGGITSKNSLMIAGLTMITLSYLVSKTLQYKNEYNLVQAVEEYNKRNTPRIYFNPFDPIDNSPTSFGMGISKEF